MQPFHGGGDMIREVHKYETTWNDLPYKFEAGTPNIADVVGFGAAIDYLSNIGMDVIKKAHENEILEEDFTVIAYCPSCQTSLSHAEVNQGYEEVKDPSLYYKVKLVDEDAFLIVWTTMPFTLVTDAMVGFQPKEDYAYVKVENQTWVIGKTRLEEFMAEVKIEDYKIEKITKGLEFEGKNTFTHYWI